LSKLTPIDLSFLLLENPARQMHMAAYQLYRLPARGRATFIPKLLEAYRNSEVARPFNQRLRWLDKGVASWETVEPDLRYHVRHLAVPAPGRMEDFFEIVSFLNTPLLDRARPLWECYVIEGIEDDHFAIFIKVHHACIDGMGAMKLFDLAMTRSASDRTIRAAWMPFEKEPRRRPASGGGQLQKLLSRVGKLPSELLQVGTSLADLGMQNLRLKPAEGSLPFGASPTLFNRVATSSERRYANCELALERVKAVSKATGTTINDVVMTVIDHALHAYLAEHDAETEKPLVAVMAMSVRTEGQAAAGNQAAIALVPMGEPGAKIRDRLQQVHAATTDAKQRSARLPLAVRQLYSLVIFGSTTLPDLVTALQAAPTGNLVISNMVGPKDQRYLAGAPLVGFHGCPIVPPGAGLNISFASVNEDICLSVGAAPEAVEDPFRVTRLILAALEELEARTRSRKTTRARVKKAARAR